MAELASALGYPTEEASIVAELKCGSEQAYCWLVNHYHQPVYSLVYRIISDPADAADTTQEVFLKVFRGMKSFNGQSSLKTWIYRIAVHEACNQKRWWRRHKSREITIEPLQEQSCDRARESGLKDVLQSTGDTPFDSMVHEEVREKVEHELRDLPEPYRTTVVLRDIEDLSYDEISQVMEVSLGTVKSRLVRGREALKKRLQAYVNAVNQELPAKAVQKSSPETEAGRLNNPRETVEVA